VAGNAPLALDQLAQSPAQVKVDFPDENTMCEELIIDRQNRKTVLRRTNPAAPAALNPAELLRLVQQH
jgi:hypothetical protein